MKTFKFDCSKHGISENYARICPKCQEEQLQQQEQRRAIERLADAKRKANIPDRFYDANLGSYEVYDERQQEVLDFFKKFHCSQNLLAYGKTGTGKTYLAMSLLINMLAKGKTGYYVKFYDLSRIEIKNYDLYEYLMLVDWLIVDEFGASDSTYKVEKFFELMDKRYDKMRFTAILSNKSLEEIKKGMTDSSISRISENCKVLKFGWQDYRVRNK